MDRLEDVERRLALVAWRWLVRRGWAVQLNTADQCSNVVVREGRAYDMGWRPLFSVRYGHQPVYRGPGRLAHDAGLDRLEEVRRDR